MKAKIKAAFGKKLTKQAEQTPQEAPQASYVPQFVEYTKEQIDAIRSDVYKPIKLNVR